MVKTYSIQIEQNKDHNSDWCNMNSSISALKYVEGEIFYSDLKINFGSCRENGDNGYMRYSIDGFSWEIVDEADLDPLIFPWETYDGVMRNSLMPGYASIEPVKLEDSVKQIYSIIEKHIDTELDEKYKKDIFDVIQETIDAQKELLMRQLCKKIMVMEPNISKIENIFKEMIVEHVQEN